MKAAWLILGTLKFAWRKERTRKATVTTAKFLDRNSNLGNAEQHIAVQPGCSTSCGKDKLSGIRKKESERKILNLRTLM